MENLAIIQASGLTKYAREPFLQGKNSLELVAAYARSLPKVKKVIILSDSELGIRDAECIVRSDWSARTLFSYAAEAASAYDDVFYVYGDCPLLDPRLGQRLYESHITYFAEYTFADGYPYGLSPEIVKPHMFKQLLALLKDENPPITRDTLFATVQRDINAFDLETELAPVDLRHLRVSLTSDTKRNFMLLQRLVEQGAYEEAAVLKVLQERQDLLRTLPAYVAVQITSGCAQACSYCPYPSMAGDVFARREEMPLPVFMRIVSEVKRVCDDAVLSISLWGEPALHSGIADIAQAVKAVDGLSLIVETSGVGWKDGMFEQIKEKVGNFIQWIVSLDAYDEKTYETLRGNGWREAQRTVEYLLGLFPGNVHVQAVRMKENEENLESFYRSWKEKAHNVIIQKYDHFCGTLMQRKVTDISPLKRSPCWHLKRDISILLDGTVTLCREDLKKEYCIGNICEDSLETIWERGFDYYVRHCNAEYPVLCETCDEYYTYNF